MRRSDTRRFIIAYDISDDRRRTKVSKLLQSQGDRIQYSVFVVDCSPAILIPLKTKLRAIIDEKIDSILFCDLGLLSTLAPTEYSYLGVEKEITSNEMLIL